MHYFAGLNTNYVCDRLIQVDDETYNLNIEHGYTYENDYCIAIDSYDTSLLYRKKYVNGEWVDSLPSESCLQQDWELVHMPDDKFLNEAIGDLRTLKTNHKSSLVGAINELYGMIQALSTANP